MIINSVENGDNVIASSDYLLHKQQVLDTGAALYEFDGGQSSHGKSILIDDDLSLIGSYNLDMRSTYMDTELMLCVQSKELNQELLGYLNSYLAQSRRILDKNNYEMPKGMIPLDHAPAWPTYYTEYLDHCFSHFVMWPETVSPVLSFYKIHRFPHHHIPLGVIRIWGITGSAIKDNVIKRYQSPLECPSDGLFLSWCRRVFSMVSVSGIAHQAHNRKGEGSPTLYDLPQWYSLPAHGSVPVQQVPYPDHYLRSQ